MKLLVGVLVALVLVPAATAAPEGFRDTSPLTVKMRTITKNPQAVVYCAVDIEAWRAKVAESIGPEGNPVAFVNVSENTAYFRNSYCVTLENWLRGKPVSRYGMGRAAHLFGHEASHLMGISDERAAECRSLSSLANTLRVVWGVKNKVAVREMVRHARDWNMKDGKYWCGGY